MSFKTVRAAASVVLGFHKSYDDDGSCLIQFWVAMKMECWLLGVVLTTGRAGALP
jgi:hypothetical protein